LKSLLNVDDLLSSVPSVGFNLEVLISTVGIDTSGALIFPPIPLKNPFKPPLSSGEFISTYGNSTIGASISASF